MLHEIGLALRFLRKNPAFAFIAIGMLAFGIAVNTTMFTMVDALALRGLPYPHSEQLVAIETHVPAQTEIEPWTSAPDFFDFRDNTQAFSDIAAISPIWNDILTGDRGAERLDTLYVSANFFSLVGVHASVGRTFTQAEDDRTHPSRVAVLSHAFWQSHFEGSPQVIGKLLRLGGDSYTVIGVLPSNFRYLGEPLLGAATGIDVWLPLSDNLLVSRPRTVRFLKVIGRLKPNVSFSRGGDDIRQMGSALSEKFPDADKGFSYETVPLTDKVSGRFRTSMLLLLGAVGFVLLMACANAASLVLARAMVRQRDFALRIALGASKYRLLRHVFAEGLVLATVSGLMGTTLAFWGAKLLVAEAPRNLIADHPWSLDLRAVIFVLFVVLVCTAVSVFPAAGVQQHVGILESLSRGGHSFTTRNHRLRSSLVVIQVSAALILLVGAGLLVRSFQRVLTVKPGFDASGVLTISTQAPPSARTGSDLTAIYDRLRQQLEAVPGVVSVGAVSRLPLMGSNLGSTVLVEGKSIPGQQLPEVEYRVATPSYFGTMRILLEEGRLFDDHDSSESMPVAVINQSMERRLWRGESAVGKRIKLGPNTETQAWITVIGVVGDIHHFGLDVEARPEVYRPFASSPLFSPILVVRTAVDPSAIAETLAAKVRSVNPEIPAYNVFSMQALVEGSTSQRRFIASLFGSFAVTALLLAAIGVYGMLSQVVTQRTQEVGLRMALGSTPRQAMILIIHDGMRLTLVGIAIGFAVAVALMPLMQNLLFGVQSSDPFSFAFAVATLIFSAALACYIPATRVTKIDPMAALRQE